MLPAFIKNSAKLGKTAERRDALSILEAGLRAVHTGKALRNALKKKGRFLSAGGRTYDLSSYRRVYVIGFGKASLSAAMELEKIIGPRISAGIILDVVSGKLKRMKSLSGTHPFPSPKNIASAGEIMELLEKADSDDLVIVIVSGGGSALLCRPAGVTCGELTLVTKALMRAGATIKEMNTVRKHLSEILGGQLAKLAYPAQVLGLVFSDVPGDDLGMIASGPTVMDKTTCRDAAAVMARYGIIKACSLSGCDLRETPKDKKFFRRVHNVLVVANRVAAEAMKAEAVKRGYRSRILSTSLQGEAREVGRRLARLPRSGEAVIAAGETTVTVSGKGRGGRSQELALGALDYVGAGSVVASCASDGRDCGPIAGALADRMVLETAGKLGLDHHDFLARNDSSPYVEKTGSAIMTGTTGINVSDLMLALKRWDS